MASVRWTDELVRILFQCLDEEEESKGKGTTGGITKPQWSSIEANFQSKSGETWNKNHLQSKLGALKKIQPLHYNENEDQWSRLGLCAGNGDGTASSLG